MTDIEFQLVKSLPWAAAPVAGRIVLETLVLWTVHRHWDPLPQPVDEASAGGRTRLPDRRPREGDLMSKHHISLFTPLAGFVVPALVIGNGVVIPRSCIRGWNELTVGFADTVAGDPPCREARWRSLP